MAALTTHPEVVGAGRLVDPVNETVIRAAHDQYPARRCSRPHNGGSESDNSSGDTYAIMNGSVSGSATRRDPRYRAAETSHPKRSTPGRVARRPRRNSATHAHRNNPATTSTATTAATHATGMHTPILGPQKKPRR